MEIKVNIPLNDYVQPTEVRQEVVQKICDVFLKRSSNVFHPFDGRAYQDKHRYIEVAPNRYDDFASWQDKSNYYNRNKQYIKFNGAEMNAAFKALINAGYHMFKTYEYGSWMGYVCNKKPFLEGGREVTEFTDFID